MKSPSPAAETPARIVWLLRWLFAATFTFTGAMHFVSPGAYESVMPPYLPYPAFLVAASGVLEIAGALGVLLPQPWRKWAGWGMVALLAAVFPANIEIARHGVTLGNGVYIAPVWGWVRLPFQILFIWWAIVVTRERGPRRSGPAAGRYHPAPEHRR